MSHNKLWAETMALQVVNFLIIDEVLRERWLAISGLTLSGLQEGLQHPENRESCVAGALDFILSDEAALLAFSEASRVKMEDVVQARMLLPGAPVKILDF